MVHHTTKSCPSGTTVTTDIVTYRYSGKLVYVPVTPNYSQALSHARDAFPQLKKLRDASLSLSLITPGKDRKFVSISPLAWPKLVAHMSRYQIIDVLVAQGKEHDIATPVPEITITYAEADDGRDRDPVPPYQKSEELDVVDDEKAPYFYPETLATSTLNTGRRCWLFQKLHGQ